MQIKAVDESTAPTAEAPAPGTAAAATVAQRGPSSSSSSGTNDVSQTSSRSRRRRRRSPRRPSPPPGVFQEGYGQRNGPPQVHRTDNFDVSKVKFLQAIDDPKWDAERIMMAFGEKAKLDSPSIMALRRTRSEDAMARILHERIDKSFRVFYESRTRTFSVRAPLPPRQAARSSRRPRHDASPPQPPSKARAVLQPSPQPPPLSFWSGVVPKPWSVEPAPNPFNTWPTQDTRHTTVCPAAVQSGCATQGQGQASDRSGSCPDRPSERPIGRIAEPRRGGVPPGPRQCNRSLDRAFDPSEPLIRRSLTDHSWRRGIASRSCNLDLIPVVLARRMR